MRTMLAFAVATTVACASKETPAPAPTVDATSDAAAEAAVDAFESGPPDPLAGCTRDPGAGDAGVGPSDAGDDPTGGTFSLEQALAGFPSSSGTLTAAITTEKGVIVCKLDDKAAPITVANFVGLARGTRPFRDPKTDAWVTRRFYDGLRWHRVIPDFVIQGGDPLGNGTGGPGYSLPVENHVPEPKGTLAMAASTEPSGSQFYIVVGKGPAANYNVFGTCATDVAIEISLVERNARDAPRVPVHMQKIEIARCP